MFTEYLLANHVTLIIKFDQYITVKHINNQYVDLFICACEAKADIGLPVADYDYDYDYDDYDYDPGIKCTKLA